MAEVIKIKKGLDIKMNGQAEDLCEGPQGQNICNQARRLARTNPQDYPQTLRRSEGGNPHFFR